MYKFQRCLFSAIFAYLITPISHAADQQNPNNYHCDTKVPIVINVRADTSKDESCLNKDNVSLCISRAITDYFDRSSTSCLRAIDVYMPGSGAENGNYNHFNYMFKRANKRAHISIQYENATKWDSALYDKSVINGTRALTAVLNAIENNISSVEEVRIFGHSKGAHIVSHVSTLYDDNDLFKFWAFAQPGRTMFAISKNKGGHTGPLGKYGYIQKHNNNLVTINWLNDEVKLYKGGTTLFSSDNNYNGLMVPQAWEYPGYINDRGSSKGNFINNRIDHHDTYGGDSERMNSYLDIEKLKEDAPYLATGDDSAYGNDENKRYKPYFWGDENCRRLAWLAMSSQQFEHLIGASGPRGIMDCKPREEQSVTVEIRYLMQRRGVTNKIDFNVVFDTYSEEAPGGKILSINIPRASKSQNQWQDFKKTIKLPDSFNLRIQPLDPAGNSGSNNTVHIAWIKVSNISDPTYKKPQVRFIIGPNNAGFEGQDHQRNLAGAKKSGWKKHPDDDSNWKLYKSREKAKLPNSRKKETYETLKFTGDGDDGQEGFYKPVSLVD